MDIKDTKVELNKMDSKNDLDKIWKQMTWREKFKHVRDNVTIEPMLALYIMSSVIAGLAVQNLNLDKACRINLNYGDEICDALNRRDTKNYTIQEKKVQDLVASMAGWKTILQSALPCLLILFWGSWSDRHGRRKPCMLIPITGELLTSIGLLFCTYFPVSMEVAGVTEALFPGLTGGWFTMMMGVFSYMSDITTEKERTLRIGIVNLCFSLGIPIGMACSGILLKKIGFYGIFAISSSMKLMALLYGIFYVKEVSIISDQQRLKLSEKGLLADFFNKEHVVETFKVAFKKGEHQRRLRVIMLLIAFMVTMGPIFGEMSVGYLFTRNKFNWDEVDFSLFSSYKMVTGLVGTSFSVGFFTHYLKMDDSLLGVISSISRILADFVFAFAQTTWQLYLGPIAALLSGTAFIALRSMASKLVASDELGKVNSLIGVAEGLMPLVYAPTYASLYRATLDTLPGAFYLLGAALTVPAIAIYLWMYSISKKIQKLNLHSEQTKSPKKSEDTESQKSIDKETKKDSSQVIRRMSPVLDSKATLAFINNGFNTEDDKSRHETVDLVKELPAHHL